MRLVGALRIIDVDQIVQQVEIDTELSITMDALVRSGESFEFAVGLVESASIPSQVINLDELYPDGVPSDPVFVEDLPKVHPNGPDCSARCRGE